MESRLRLKGWDAARGIVLAEFPDTPEGKKQGEAFRRAHPAQFRGRRLRSGIQMWPSSMPVGEIVTATFFRW